MLHTTDDHSTMHFYDNAGKHYSAFKDSPLNECMIVYNPLQSDNTAHKAYMINGNNEVCHSSV